MLFQTEVRETLVHISKSKVDKIGDAIRHGLLNAEVLLDLDRYRLSFGDAFGSVEHVLKENLGLEISARPAKSTIAIFEKLRRETIRLSQIQDIAGCRVVISTLAEQSRIVGAMSVMLGVDEPDIDDKIRLPTNGYRAIHLVCRTFGLPVEVQVRTRFQHLWAQISERLADMYGQEVKYGGGHPEVLELLSDLSDKSHRLDQASDTLVQEKIKLNQMGRVSPRAFRDQKSKVKNLEVLSKARLRDVQVLLQRKLPDPPR